MPKIEKCLLNKLKGDFYNTAYEAEERGLTYYSVIESLFDAIQNSVNNTANKHTIRVWTGKREQRKDRQRPFVTFSDCTYKTPIVCIMCNTKGTDPVLFVGDDDSFSCVHLTDIDSITIEYSSGTNTIKFSDVVNEVDYTIDILK